jgi:hypothetical protein
MSTPALRPKQSSIEWARGIFRRGKAAGVTLTTDLHLMLRVRMSGAIPLLLTYTLEAYNHRFASVMTPYFRKAGQNGPIVSTLATPSQKIRCAALCETVCPNFCPRNHIMLCRKNVFF